VYGFLGGGFWGGGKLEGGGTKLQKLSLILSSLGFCFRSWKLGVGFAAWKAFVENMRLIESNTYNFINSYRLKNLKKTLLCFL
jgi:hypothetical protein